MEEASLRARIRAIMDDPSLSEDEKSEARQKLMAGNFDASRSDVPPTQKKEEAAHGVGDTLKCTICLSVCDRPVTAPCQHNFCLGCFSRWTGKGNKTCPTCRTPYSKKFALNPRVNTIMVAAIRMAKAQEKGVKKSEEKPFVRMDNDSRPEKAFMTERAQRNGRANVASGRIMVNVPNDWFGPIFPEHDPENKRGVCVGDWWADRMDCRQYGAHFPHVAGIAGQAHRGAQSVVLSGGYEDDLDNGDWFLYTGSGGRDLSGNKRTNKNQSFDQEFKSYNEALRVSCIKGLPIRVVRSHKEKRSAYAPPPEMPVRYDGIYRILRCWRKTGKQNFIMCRYLFVRCDNAPAPWSSSDHGDAPNLDVPEAALKEIREAYGKVHSITDQPYWDWEKETGAWGFVKEQPPRAVPRDPKPRKAPDPKKLLQKFKCRMCHTTLRSPVSTPCGHSFCKACLEAKFASVEDIIDRTETTGRTLRIRKVIKPCPVCQTDIGDFLKTAPVNRELEELIEKLKGSQGTAGEASPREATSQASDSDGEDVNKPGAQDTNQSGREEASGLELQLESICLSYPDFERDVIQGLMADQGNDTEEVIYCLEKMRKMKLQEEDGGKGRCKRSRSHKAEDENGESPEMKKAKENLE